MRHAQQIFARYRKGLSLFMHRLCERYGLNARVYRDEEHDPVREGVAESGAAVRQAQLLLPLEATGSGVRAND